jgi:hypothetical protein
MLGRLKTKITDKYLMVDELKSFNSLSVILVHPPFNSLSIILVHPPFNSLSVILVYPPFNSLSVILVFSSTIIQ